MNRRMFAQSVGSAAMFSSPGRASEAAGRLYRLEYLYFPDVRQAQRFEEALALQKPAGILGVFRVVVGPHVPATVVLSALEGFEQLDAAASSERADRLLLRATDFSPVIAPPGDQSNKPRIFEMRTDHVPAGRQSQALHELCAGPEMGLFRRAGICPMFYADVLVGPNMPGLTYLIPFASLAGRQKAWDALAADPDWVKLSRAGSQLARQSEIVLLSPAPFSPIR